MVLSHQAFGGRTSWPGKRWRREKSVLIVTIANMNKGVGKTVATQRLTGALVKRRVRALLLDLDPEMDHNLTHALSSQRLGPLSTHTLYDALEEKRAITPFEVGPALALIPAHSNLQRAETWRSLALDQLGALDAFLRHARIEVYAQRHQLAQMYEVCLIDCPPNISVLTLHAYVAADHILIPEWAPPEAGQRFGGYPMTMDTAIRQRYRNARPTAGVCSKLSLPFDPRLARSTGHLLSPEVSEAVAAEQDAYWQQLATEVIGWIGST
jgi:AAA domain